LSESIADLHFCTFKVQKIASVTPTFRQMKIVKYSLNNQALKMCFYLDLRDTLNLADFDSFCHFHQLDNDPSKVLFGKDFV
jgi:hypothetical protein